MKSHDRQSAGLGTIQRLPSGRYRGRVTVATVDGKQIRRSVTADSRKAVQDELLRLRAEAQGATADPVPNATRLTVGDTIDAYETHLDARVASGHLKQSTRDYYTSMLKHAAPLRDILLRNLSPADIERWLPTTGKAASTRRGAFIALRGALQQAADAGWVTRNPAARIKAPVATPTRKVIHATDTDVKSLLDALEAPFRDVALLLAHTGLRLGEALALTWDDIDLASGVLYVRGGKTARARRSVPLTPTLSKRLKEMRQDEGWVFPGRGDVALDKRTFARAFESAAPRKGLTPHSLRHGAATRLLEAGTPVHIVSAILGHSSPQITLDIYAHSVSDMEKEAMGALDM